MEKWRGEDKLAKPLLHYTSYLLRSPLIKDDWQNHAATLPFSLLPSLAELLSWQ